MGLLCTIAGHAWHGCTCERCGARRSSSHQWNGCVCEICGATRDAEHSWNGCICEKCKKKRDELHEITGCTCTVCGQEFHTPSKGRCSQCGEFLVEYVGQWGPHSYCSEIISGRQVTRYYTIEDRECYRCGGPSPHLVKSSNFLGAVKEDSRSCITCGDACYCDRCKKYVPELIDADNFDGAWKATGHRCPYCKGLVSKR